MLVTVKIYTEFENLMIPVKILMDNVYIDLQFQVKYRSKHL